MNHKVIQAVRDSLQLSNYDKEIFTQEQIEAIAKAIESAITAHENQQHC